MGVAVAGHNLGRERKLHAPSANGVIQAAPDSDVSRGDPGGATTVVDEAPLPEANDAKEGADDAEEETGSAEQGLEKVPAVVLNPEQPEGLVDLLPNFLTDLSGAPADFLVDLVLQLTTRPPQLQLPPVDTVRPRRSVPKDHDDKVTRAARMLPLRASMSIWRPVKGDAMAQNRGQGIPRLHGYDACVTLASVTNKPIRIDADALARWKATTGIELDDGAAANAAIRTAAGLREREAEAMAYGMRWLIDLIDRGHVPAGPDVTISVEGSKLTISTAGGQIVAVLEAGGSRVVPS